MIRPELHEFVTRMNAFSIAMGLPPSIAKVLTHLTVCQPAEQTAAKISSELSISAGSVSEALSMLRHVELIERKKKPGDRRFYYEILPDGWKRATLRRLRTLDEGIKIADTGLKIEPDNQRLKAMHDMYSIFSREFADFEKRFK
jgi:DNA-binding transcriptional regulator GbsR (MarR family)